MNPRLGWLLAALFAFATWRAYGLAGPRVRGQRDRLLAAAHFNRAVRVMKNAGAAPVGHVASAVMFHAGLRPA